MSISLITINKHPSPFVKWAGGKGSLIEHLLPHVPGDLSDYYEPFLGGGALFFAICSRNSRFRAHLSDTNSELVNSYTVTKNRPEELVQLLTRLQQEYDNSPSKSRFYYEKRDWHPTDPLETATRLIFLNKTCYNGLYRVNSKGEFNVPFGRYKHPRISDPENIRAASIALRETSADLLVSDYKTSISRCGRNDFVYLDPPYQPQTRTSSFTGYTPSGFSEIDQKELADEFSRLVDRGCRVLLSNSETPLTRQLYRQFQLRRVTVNRPISCVGTKRSGYKELIVLGNFA